MATYKLIATAAMGLESVVAKEVQQLGFDTTVENGKIMFEGIEEDIARANLWLRTADRVKIVMGEFKVYSFDQLFEQTKALPWESLLPVDAAFPVSGKSIKSQLYSVPDCQAIVKKAIVEKLKAVYKRTSFLDETGPTYKIEVAIRNDVATLTIDTSGAGLHKRGYRLNQGEAPLKETMAAALVQLTNWRPDRPFHDPFCGSGTIAIEAALIGQNIAPGFNRSFISEEWPVMKKAIWDKVRKEAEDAADYDQVLEIYATDIDHKMVEIAKQNAIEAGLGEIIQFKQMQVRDFTAFNDQGVIVGNPPYGERIGEEEAVETISCSSAIH